MTTYIEGNNAVFRLVFKAIMLAACCFSATGATTPVASMSRTDMVNAIAAASAGDTLLVPAGHAQWSSAVTIPASKPLKIIGAGKNASYIVNTSGGENTWLFLVDTEMEDAEIRISGFGMYGTNTTGNAQGSGVFIERWQKNVRVDNCSFTDMRRHGVQFVGFEAYGVVDHCYFTNNYTAIEVNGNDTQSWDFPAQTPFGLGTTNCVTVEDCYFENNDNSLVTDLNNTIYVSNGGRIDMRNCTANGFGSEQNFVFWDSHGNNSQDTEPAASNPIGSHNWAGDALRGTIFASISNLVLHADTSYRHFYLRGGTHIMVGVTATGPAGADVVVLSEEECWATMSFATMDDTWPAPDGITNTWVDVTYNGVQIDEARIINDHGDNNSPDMDLTEMDEVFIQLNHDYFLVTSAASIPALSTSHPTISGGYYGANWQTYPHIRVSADGGGGTPSGSPTSRGVTARVGTVRSP